MRTEISIDDLVALLMALIWSPVESVLTAGTDVYRAALAQILADVA